MNQRYTSNHLKTMTFVRFLHFLKLFYYFQKYDIYHCFEHIYKLSLLNNLILKNEMKTSQIFWTEKNDRVEIWHETINQNTNYWKKVNGVSEIVSERMYRNMIKKYNLLNTLQS